MRLVRVAPSWSLRYLSSTISKLFLTPFLRLDQTLRRGRFSLILGKLIMKELLLQKDVLGISIRECVASSSKGALLIPMNQSKGMDELF